MLHLVVVQVVQHHRHIADGHVRHWRQTMRRQHNSRLPGVLCSRAGSARRRGSSLLRLYPSPRAKKDGEGRVEVGVVRKLDGKARFNQGNAAARPAPQCSIQTSRVSHRWAASGGTHNGRRQRKKAKRDYVSPDEIRDNALARKFKLHFPSPPPSRPFRSSSLSLSPSHTSPPDVRASSISPSE